MSAANNSLICLGGEQLARLHAVLMEVGIDPTLGSCVDHQVAQGGFQELHPTVEDVVEFLRLARELSAAPAPDAPHVSKVTPFIQVPWALLSTKTPIGDYIVGNVPDAFALSARRCSYFVYRGPLDDVVHLAEVRENGLFTAMEDFTSLERLLETSEDLERLLSYLLYLARNGILAWLRPLETSSSCHQG